MSSRRRRYPKRSEVEGPPPNYGGKEEESEESEDEESIDSLDVDSDSEDTDMEDVVMTIKDCRPCKVDLPNLRVERGKSQDVEVPREVMLSPWLREILTVSCRLQRSFASRHWWGARSQEKR